MTPAAQKSAEAFLKGGSINPYRTTVIMPGNEEWVESTPEFYEWGARDWKQIKSAIPKGFTPESVLEYGCGCGRILKTSSRYRRESFGVDLVPEMRSAAKRACPSSTILSVEDWKASPPFVDLSYSWVTLQHIPQDDGMEIVETLVDNSRVAVLHIVYKDLRPWPIRALWRASFLPVLSGVSNVLRRRPWSDPRIPMFTWDLEKVYRRLSKPPRAIYDILVPDTDWRGTLLVVENL